MKQQRIFFKKDKELSKKAVDRIINILQKEKAKDINIDFDDEYGDLIFAYNTRTKN